MQKSPIREILKKEAMHFAGGTALGLALIFLPHSPILVFLAVVTFLMVALEIVRFSIPTVNIQIGRWFPFVVRKSMGEEKSATGMTYFLLASLLAVLAFPKPIAITAIFLSALGDPIASLVGTWRGKTIFRGKSLEGDVACLVICLVIGGILAISYNGLTIIVAGIGAVAATVLQATNLRLNDNVTITVGSALVMWAVSLLGI